MRCLLPAPRCFERKNLLNERCFAAQEWPCLSAKTILRLNPWACESENNTQKDKALTVVKLAKVLVQCSVSVGALFCLQATVIGCDPPLSNPAHGGGPRGHPSGRCCAKCLVCGTHVPRPLGWTNWPCSVPLWWLMYTA